MKINNTWTEIPVNYTLILNSRMINLFEHNDKEYYLVLVTEPNHWELWRRDNNGKANVASPVKIFSNDSYEEAKDWSNNYFNQKKAWAMTSEAWKYWFRGNSYTQRNAVNNVNNTKLKNGWRKVDLCVNPVLANLQPKLVYVHSSGKYLLVKSKRFDFTPHWELWKSYTLTSNGREDRANCLVVFNANICLNDAKWWFKHSNYNTFDTNNH